MLPRTRTRTNGNTGDLRRYCKSLGYPFGATAGAVVPVVPVGSGGTLILPIEFAAWLATDLAFAPRSFSSTDPLGGHTRVGCNIPTLSTE